MPFEGFYQVKNDQISIYKRGDLDEILIFHENMFYNCLIRGLWNYSYYDTVKSKTRKITFS